MKAGRIAIQFSFSGPPAVAVGPGVTVGDLRAAALAILSLVAARERRGGGRSIFDGYEAEGSGVSRSWPSNGGPGRG